ncbi:MAG: hypothetical protein HKN22_03005, partial [Bacteroidia bacterium]|nr:hypothetical protein [Bacteroidia bacterium]
MPFNRTINLSFAKFLLLIIFAFGISFPGYSQQNISDYLIYTGQGGPGTTVPGFPGYGVQASSSTSLNGTVGTMADLSTTGNSSIIGDIHVGGTISIANSNVLTGNISAANNLSVTGNSISIGSSASIDGNLDANGNVQVGGGFVNGVVTIGSSFIYNGPTPSGGIVNGTPNLPNLPSLPTPTVFPAHGSANVTGTTTITPGSYGDMILTGKKRLTFDGPGVYVFKSIQNSGNANTFRFNFQNDPYGVFLIYIHNDVDLNKVDAILLNGGSASRIYAETHGTGSTSSSGYDAWVMANGGSGKNSNSKWLGTIYAPYGALNIGSGTGSSSLTGAFWSGTQVVVKSGVNLIHAPFVQCVTPDANAGLDKELTCTITSMQLSGSSSNSGAQFNWTTIGGNIVSGGNTATPTI